MCIFTAGSRETFEQGSGGLNAVNVLGDFYSWIDFFAL
jgi:hypothetical protein